MIIAWKDIDGMKNGEFLTFHSKKGDIV